MEVEGLEGNSSARAVLIGYENTAKITASAEAVVQAQATLAVANAVLALAVEVRAAAKGWTGVPAPVDPEAEPEVEDLSEKEIDELAARLWEVDSQSPARRFEDDYESTQNKYRLLALAALGLTDGPEEKK